LIDGIDKSASYQQQTFRSLLDIIDVGWKGDHFVEHHP